MGRPPLEITKTLAVVYKLRNIPEGGWADITLREWKGGGTFDCQSDYGNYANTWTAIGSRTFKQFLCGLDMDYFLKKTRPRDYRIFDAEKTCKQIKENIIESRKNNDLSKEDARTCWEEIDDIENEDPNDTTGFWYLLEKTRLVELIYDWDPSAVPSATTYNYDCIAFWERVWPHITKYWEENPE